MNGKTRNQPKSGPPRGSDDIGAPLGVWAHPDDEAHLVAGLMSVVRAAGHRVVVATATKGELGTEDPVALPPERLAVILERETAASLAALDVREHRWLGHRVGSLEQVPVTHGISRITGLIQEMRPDTRLLVGVTGRPIGSEGHGVDDGMRGGDQHLAGHAPGPQAAGFPEYLTRTGAGESAGEETP